MLGLIFVVKANLNCKFTLTNWNSRFALQVLFSLQITLRLLVIYINLCIYLFIYFLSLSDTLSALKAKTCLNLTKKKAAGVILGTVFFVYKRSPTLKKFSINTEDHCVPCCIDHVQSWHKGPRTVLILCSY